MGFTIGMTVAAACELIYWLTLKPFVKLMSSRWGNEITSTKWKFVYIISILLVFLSWAGFSAYYINFIMF